MADRVNSKGSELTAAESIRIVSQGLDNWLVEQVGVAVIAVDPVGVVLRWNREAERIYGWPAGDAVGRRLEDHAKAPREVRL